MFQNLWKSARLFRNVHYLQARYYSPKLREHLAGFPDVYSQKNVEKFWSTVWVDQGLFKQTKEIEADKNAFRMLLPPPNITGDLHLGHSLTVAIQDTLCRYHRMNGRPVVWYGGTDHAGIATQMLVEKMMAAKYNKSRHDITKEEFEAFFDKWKLEKTSNIRAQLEAMGTSIDFDKTYFTLSPELKEFVQDSFIELFNRGLIYRASYMVNWSYYLQSTLSDIEIEHKFISRPTMINVPGCEEAFEVGVLHRFRYPIALSSDSAESEEYLTVATTRVESLMGDVALAVNPEDSRYAKYIGKEAFNPFTKQRMPIVGDKEVKMDFGTGVLKLTPAHCDVDAEICKRHGLPMDLVIFDEKGYVRCDYEKFNGVHRYAAKKLVIEELKALGLYEGMSEHPHWLPLCSRSGDIIEHKQVPQWFLKADDARFATEFVVNRDNLSESSIEKWKQLNLGTDVKERNISLIPSGYRNTWRDWFSRYKDWCISRQIAWGHQIPAYEALDSNGKSIGWVAAKSDAEAEELAKRKFPKSDGLSLRKDKDVLDTWFSSALLPIAISKDLPLSLMETGHDILFFWVARMVLMSILLKDRLPFERILLHGMICDASGKKMSKSKGNVIDPMHLIHGARLDDLISKLKTQLDNGAISEDMFTDKMTEYIKSLPKGIEVCGADVLRLSLLQSDFKDQKVNFDLTKTLKRRAFVNKMHHTVRFMIMQFNDLERMGGNLDLELPKAENLTRMERWIYQRLSDLIQETRDCFESYDLYKAAKKLERFWVEDLCDVYVENLKGKENKNLAVFTDVTLKALQVMHPFMPFITENLYQHILYKTKGGSGDFKSILSTQFPDVEQFPLLKACDPTVDEDFQTMFDIVRKIRWFKQNFFVNKEPIVKKIIVLSNKPRIQDCSEEIATHIRIPDCELEFMSLYDIYQLDDIGQNWYCFPVEKENDTSKLTPSQNAEENPQKEPVSKSLESDEIYIAFQLEPESLYERFRDSKFRLKQEKIENLTQEINDSHCRNFTKNFKKLTKINV